MGKRCWNKGWKKAGDTLTYFMLYKALLDISLNLNIFFKIFFLNMDHGLPSWLSG